MDYKGKNKNKTTVTINDIKSRTYVRGSVLVSKNYKQTVGLLQRSKPIFRFAVDCGYLTVSPFAKVKGGSSSRENTEYISLQRIEGAFIACEDNLEYRSLLAFARYEGLRVPSEIRDLKFSDFRNIETGIIFTISVTEKTSTSL